MTDPIETEPAPRSGEGAAIRAADAVAVASLALGLFVMLFGGFVFHLGPLAVSVRGPERLLFVAIALVAIRHTAHPANPLHRRIGRGFRSGTGTSPAAITRAALLSRIMVLVAGYFAVVTIGVAPSLVGFEVSPDAALNLPARFDAGWYAGIALEGYSFEGRFDKQQNIAFFPAFPMLERVAGYPHRARPRSQPATGPPQSSRRRNNPLWLGDGPRP